MYFIMDFINILFESPPGIPPLPPLVDAPRIWEYPVYTRIAFRFVPSAGVSLPD